MNTPQRGLGRGLGSLIPTRPVHYGEREAGHDTSPEQSSPDAWGEEDSTGGARPAKGAPSFSDTSSSDDPMPVPAGVYFAELPIGSIRPNPRQPRSVFDEESLAELVSSIRAVGLLQPVVVREVSSGAFELVMGERRWRAAQWAGLTEIPSIVRETADHDLLRDALLENLHRADLNPLEEAAAYRQLLDDFGCTHDELAGRISRSRPQISNTLRLLRLSVPVQRRVAAGVLSAGHARALVAVEDSATQDALAARAVAEGMSVRTLEEQVAVRSADRSRRSTRRASVTPAPELAEVAGRLSDRLDTRCKVELGRSKGKITIEFASLDDLGRIVAVVDPQADDEDLGR